MFNIRSSLHTISIVPVSIFGFTVSSERARTKPRTAMTNSERRDSALWNVPSPIFASS